MKSICISVTLLALLASAACAADPVFDLDALLATPVNARVVKTHPVKDGIVTEEVLFHSEMDGDTPVDIFAYFSYPEGGRDLPAFIWNQGGLAQASPYWTEFGAKRGYAALCIDFPIGGYRSPGGRWPINSGLEVGDDPREAPIYHGAVALLKAVSFLESRAEVDGDRIGMVGSSWGGFYTTLMAGVDPRLKAASAMFGTGNLHLGNSWWAQRDDEALRERWARTLDPALRLKKGEIPIAWITGTNDNFYWLNAVKATYDGYDGPRHLTLLANYDHGLTPEIDEQVFAWLDVHLKGRPPFATISPVALERTVDGATASWTVTHTPEREIDRCELYISYGDAGNWQARYWKHIGPLELQYDKPGVGQGSLPLLQSPMPFYIYASAVDADGFVYSTSPVRVDPLKWGLHDPQQPLTYDGCAMWGGFEAEHIRFARALGFFNVETSDDARAGEQSAVLKAGTTRLQKVLFTAGLEHRLTAHFKASEPVDVTVRLAGNIDGKKHSESRTLTVGADWTPLTIDFTPPADVVWGGLGLEIDVPQGRQVLIDSVSFRPLPPGDQR